MPPGRKPKGKGEEIDAGEAIEALKRLDNNQAAPDSILQKVFSLLQPECPPACGAKGSKGSKDNPHCFCALIPAEGSYRKKGLWQKEPVLGQLGHDPAEDRRKGPDVPAGLRNLGNTCYVNAAMQFLHAIPDFRHALYVLEPELAEQDIVQQLRDLFIGLHFGPRRYVDPEPFANSLQLNHAIQQDGQEFLKLLLSKLEAVFAASGQQEVATVVQRLFRGHFSYVTTCRSCQQQSEGSKRQVEYYELPLQVQHMPSLQQSMVSALSPEELVGDNQYYCEVCGGKCDAERQMRLRSLPPYLCLSLQRFVFDMQTFEKKKALDKLSIPLLLDMGDVLAASGLAQPDAAPTGPDGNLLLPGAAGCQYELAAVLIHKGTSASHGHYVAHIKMPDSGTWWRFDDETAEDMGQQPTSFPADHGTTAQAQAAAAGGSTSNAAAAGEEEEEGSGKKATVGSKRGRGGGGGGSNKRGKAAAGGSKAKGGGSRGGRGGRGGRGRGKSKKGSVENGDFSDEDAAMQAAMQLSLQQQQFANGEDVDMAFLAAQQQQQEQELAAAQQDEAAAAAAAAQSEGGRRKRKGAGAAADGTGSGAVKEAGQDKGAAAQQGGEQQLEIVSGNAYFLVYRQCISSVGSNSAAAAAAAPPDGVAGAALAAAEGDTAAGNAGSSAAAAAEQDAAADVQPAAAAAGNGEQQFQLHPHLLQQLQQLPDEVRQRVLQLHQEFEQACANHMQMREDARARVEQRKQEVQTLHQLLQPQDDSDSGCFISAAWLDGWANSDASPGPVDNGELLCTHGKLSPDKPAGSMKHISSAAWEHLVAAHKGGPRLGLEDTCTTCLRTQLQGLVRSDALLELRDRLLDRLAQDDQDNSSDPDMAVGYYVSKSWLTGFKTRRSVGGGNLQPPTAGIACCHGKLAPEALSGTAKRVVVSDGSWELLQQLWVMQVQREVAARQAKAAKAAAKAAAAGQAVEAGDGDVTMVEDDDRDVKIVDAPDMKQEHQHGEQQQQQQEDQDSDGDVMIQEDPSSGGQQQQQSGSRAASPAAHTAAGVGAATPPVAPSWQLPFPLDGSVPVTEEILLQHMPSFHSVHEMECEQCRASLQEAAAGHQEVKQQLEAQKAALSKLLATTVQETLELGVPYYLVPNDWLAAWRNHMMAASSKKLSSSGLPLPPPPLPDAVRPLLCRCHPDNPGVAVELPLIVNKRGRFAQADPQKDMLRVITEQDWLQLMLHHSGLQLDMNEGSTAEAAGTSQDQAEAGEAAAGGGRSSRARRGSAAKQNQQRVEQRAQQQEQLDMLQQLIASMAASDPAYRGIRATLQVEAAAATAAGAAGEADQQQQQQQQANGLPDAPQPQQQNVQQQGEQQQQQQPDAMDVDDVVVVCSPPHRLPQQVTSVDLTQPSPGCKQQAAGAAAATSSAQADGSAAAVGDVELVAERFQVAGAAAAEGVVLMPSTAGAGVNAGLDGQALSEMYSEEDPDGLEAATAKAGDDDWQPDDAEAMPARTRPAGRTNTRATRRGAAAAAASGAADGSDGEAGGGPAGAVPAAAALRGWLVTVPALCQQHLAVEAAARRAALLVYDDAEVMVELTQQEDLAAAFTAAAGAERKSKRARKNRQPVKVRSGDTLAQLKLKVFEVLGVHPRNQRLYARGTLLEGEQQTLAQLEVFPDEELRVVNTGEVPDDDYSSVFDGVSAGRKRREVETGFRDTALVSMPPAAAAAAAAEEPPAAGEGPAANGDASMPSCMPPQHQDQD